MVAIVVTFIIIVVIVVMIVTIIIAHPDHHHHVQYQADTQMISEAQFLRLLGGLSSLAG